MAKKKQISLDLGNLDEKLSSDNYMKDKLNFVDKVNVKNAKYIFNLTLNQFKNAFWNKLELDQNGRGWDLKTFYSEVRKFCSEVIRNRVKDKDYALIKRKYRYSNNKNGRIYSCGFGIQSLQGNIRKFLTGDYLLDIDIKNCHPNILYKLVLEYNEKHDDKLSMMYLENYVKNRNKVLKEHNFDKLSLLVCLNSDEVKTNKKDKGFYTKNAFLIGLHKEKMNIFNNLIHNTSYIKDYEIVSDNEKNPISSKINKLFCIKENEIIQSVMKSDICVPMFDGFMFDKTEKDKYDYLLEEEGIIQWDYKANFINIDTSDFNEEESKDYDSIKIKFEEECCMIKTEPIIFLKQFLNEENKLEDRYFSERSMRTESKPLQIVDEKGKDKDFFDEWLKDKEKRSYNKFCWNPYTDKTLDSTPEHIYNTFKEFPVTLLEEYEEPKWFFGFIFNNIADEHNESYEYLLNYCADFVQRPYKNCEIALVLRGEGGIGKDRFVDFLQAMTGVSNNYVHRTVNINDILPTDGFNSELKNKLLVQFNETSGKAGLEAKEHIKDHINRLENNIKEKYVTAYKQKNLAQVIFCSNNNSPLAFSFDERKFVMFKCGNKNKGKNKEYWEPLDKEFKTPGKINHLYTYLMKRDISNWHPVEDRPLTKAYKIAVSNAIPHHIKWLKSLFIDNQDLNIVFKNRKDIYYAKTKTIYNSFRNWACENHLMSEGQFKSQAFKTALLNINGIVFDKKIKINGVAQRFVVFSRLAVLNELKKYTFDVEEDNDILDFDMSDEE
tara:strand:- start:614 stop:2941 length:2328 start_codon:yes stop_codon:yes gene_type:complete